MYVPHRFWAEAVFTLVYLLNRSPTMPVKKTPKEAWFGRKPKVSHLEVLDLLCIVGFQLRKEPS